MKIEISNCSKQVLVKGTTLSNKIGPTDRIWGLKQKVPLEDFAFKFPR